MTMHKFLISTFRRLLKVTLTLDGELQSCDVMSDGYGIYFGLAHAANVVFVAERNLDIDKNLVTPNAPQNAIRLYLQVPGGALLRQNTNQGSPSSVRPLSISQITPAASKRCLTRKRLASS